MRDINFTLPSVRFFGGACWGEGLGGGRPGSAASSWSALESLPRSAHWGVWLDTLRDLAAATLRYPDAVTEILDELQPMADIGPVDIAAVLLRNLSPVKKIES